MNSEAKDEGLGKLQQIRNMHRQFGNVISSNYDVSDICNLKCEGCLYYSGASNVTVGGLATVGAWDRFFLAEAERGVNFGYFSGAEPSLTQDVLRAAMPYIRNGMVTTNGIKRIEKDIRYRIHLSLWGGEALSASVRGADNGKKALANYAGDDRVVAVFTINRQNISDIVPVSMMCADHGIPITFSYFSPTEDYLARLRGDVHGESVFFKARTESERILLDQADFTFARNAIREAQEAAPSFVLYSLDYDRWVTREGGVYTLDNEGLATNCGVRMAAHHRHFNVDISMNRGKCCSPNINCEQCRIYSNGYATFLSRLRQFVRSDADFEMLVNVWKLWNRIFMLPQSAITQATGNTNERLRSA